MTPAIARENLATYLLRIGFHGPVSVTRWRDGRPRAEIFVRSGYAIEVPFNNDDEAYRARVREWVRYVAKAENKGTDRVLSEVSNAATDIVRVTIASPESGIGFQRAHSALGGISALLVAAAGDVEGRRVRHSANQAGVKDFLRRTELGHTERGSYVFPIKVNLGPSKSVELPIPTSEARSAPRWRQPIVRMRELLDLADRIAAEVARPESRIEVADDAIPDGLSISLCRGLLRLRQAAEYSVNFDWSFALAYDWPAWKSRTLVSQRRHLDALEDISRHLEVSQPEPEYVLQGRVVRLDRGREAPDGTIAVIEPGERKPIRVRLYGFDYTLAVHAHLQRRDLRVIGTLSGRELEGPTQVSVEDPTEPLLDVFPPYATEISRSEDVDS